MRDHIRLLGILNLVWGCLALAIGAMAWLILGGSGLAAISSGDKDGPMAAGFLSLIGGAIFLIVAIISVPTILGGWGLLKHKPWSRMLVLVLSVLHLFSVPVGTALGVYGFWVLTKDESKLILA